MSGSKSGYAPKLPEFDPLNPTKMSKPRVNPLGNPLIYRTTTQAAIDYRELLFDTPEEVQDAVQYQAHMDTCKALKDYPDTVGPALKGNRTTPTSVHSVPEHLPLVDYLTRADYYGKTTFGPDDTLGGTAFTVRMLADSLSQPDVAISDNKIGLAVDELEGYVEPLGDLAKAPYVPPVRRSSGTPTSNSGGSSGSTGTAGQGDEDDNTVETQIGG